MDEREDRLLGTMPDVDLAAKLDRTVQSITSRRHGLGVRCFFPPGRGPWKKSEAALLGELSDREIAHRLGRGFNAVSYRRKQLGIRVSVSAQRNR